MANSRDILNANLDLMVCIRRFPSPDATILRISTRPLSGTTAPPLPDRISTFNPTMSTAPTNNADTRNGRSCVGTGVDIMNAYPNRNGKCVGANKSRVVTSTRQNTNTRFTHRPRNGSINEMCAPSAMHENITDSTMMLYTGLSDRSLLSIINATMTMTTPTSEFCCPKTTEKAATDRTIATKNRVFPNSVFRSMGTEPMDPYLKEHEDAT